MSNQEEITVLKLTLHGRVIGYLAGFQSGRNVRSFSDDFRLDHGRPTFSLITHPDFPNATKVLSDPWVTNQRLHPVLSNLLPEGALRELIAQALKVHMDNEFQLLACLGEDLPGALVGMAIEPEEVPDYVLNSHGNARAVKFNGIG